MNSIHSSITLALFVLFASGSGFAQSVASPIVVPASSAGVALSTIAVPLSVGVSAVAVSRGVSAGAVASMNAASEPIEIRIGQPLPVSDRVIIRMPPNEALEKNRVNQQQR